MTLLDDLATEIDIDAAFASFTYERDRRRRRRHLARTGTTIAIATAVVVGALLVAHRGQDRDRSVHVAGPAFTTTTFSTPPPEVARAMDAYLHANPSVHERARARVNAETWVLIAEGLRFPHPNLVGAPSVNVGSVEFDLGLHGWTQSEAAGTGRACVASQDVASHVSVSHGVPLARVTYRVAITANPSWGIQVLRNGTWKDLPTFDGVYFDSRPNPPVGDTMTPPPQFRPITPDGHTPSCYKPQPAPNPVSWRLLAIADRAAAVNGGRADHVEAVQSTASRAAAFSSGDIIPGTQPVWLIQIQGNFTCRVCSRPPDAKAPHSKVIQLIVEVGTYNEIMFGTSDHAQDLSRLGHDLALRR